MLPKPCLLPVAAAVALAGSFAVLGRSAALGSDRAQELEPTVILISLDGFRWDYLDIAETPNLDRLAAAGVRAEALVPIFPTKTFPNHYSIATGLYADHHGIVGNAMYDPELDASFSMRDRAAVSDSRWWGGEPIWVTAEAQGQVAAAYFWVGTDVEIAGRRPTHWKPYDGRTPNAARVRQVLEWIDLPDSKRPTLFTLYFSIVDGAGHRYGPASAQVKEAIARVDAAIGLLLDGLEDRGIWDRLNIVVTSDHGMASISPRRVIFLDDYLDLSDVYLSALTPVADIWPDEGREDAVYRALANAHPHLTVYRKRDIPERLHYRHHRRIAPIIAIADEGWSIARRGAFNRRSRRYTGGTHGYDNSVKSMHALFIASGPAFKDGLVVEPFQNIHIYELLCAVLGLRPAPNDGSLDSVVVMLEGR